MLIAEHDLLSVIVKAFLAACEPKKSKLLCSSCRDVICGMDFSAFPGHVT